MERRSWGKKFADAFRGMALAMWGQSSFAVHGIIALAVLAASAYLRVTTTDFVLLLLCITLVLVAETFNSSLERLAKAVDCNPNADLGAALDISSAAVLWAALGAASIGLIVLLPYLMRFPL